MRPSQRLIPALACALALSACNTLASPAGPAPLEAPIPTLLPAAAVTLWVVAPDTTPSNATLQLELFDQVAGFGAPVSVMTMQGDGVHTWSVQLTPPAGSVLYYRFVRTSPTRAVEADAAGQEIMSRVSLVDGPTQIHEVIAAWAGAPKSIPTGRIVGTIFDALRGSPLPDILVIAGGRSAFTDGQGAFRLDGLPAGLHNLVALSPSGASLAPRAFRSWRRYCTRMWPWRCPVRTATPTLCCDAATATSSSPPGAACR